MKRPPLVDRIGGAAPGPLPQAPAPGPAPAAPPPVALVAFHGMGQQVRYGTIEETLDVLERGIQAAGGAMQLRARRQHHDAERLVACAEVDLQLADGGVQPVHVYETYWAPLSEGRITTWRSFTFLFWSAWDGAWSGRTFKRFLFGAEPEDVPVSRRTLWGLALAAGVIAALWVFDAVALAAVASGVLVQGEPGWFASMRGLLLGDYVGTIVLLLVAALLFVLVPSWLRRGTPATRRLFCELSNVGLRVAAVLLVVLGLDVLLTCLLTVFTGAEHLIPRSAVAWALGPLSERWSAAIGELAKSRRWIAVFGSLVLFASWIIGRFVREYVGDVAIYVASHRLDRFHEARAAIQKTACDLLRFVYARRDATDEPAYGRVVLMGHSLGSVIAYDTFNRLALDDAAAGNGLGVVPRTSALVTYGSPLDKIAFVFRTQRKQDGTLREALAASRQPLIDDPATRWLWWVNVYSHFDWIGGDLDYFDSRFPQAVRPVVNLEDCEATTPLQAHSEHVDGTLLPSVVTSAVTNTLGLNEHVMTGLERERRLRELPVDSPARRTARRRC